MKFIAKDGGVWDTDLESRPINTPYLVHLYEKYSSMYVHAGQKMKCANGFICIVGGHTESDVGPVLAWRPMVDTFEPEDLIEETENSS